MRRMDRPRRQLMDECLLCGAPGGHPYCNDACRDADNPDD
jgi:hypothetical protein